MYVHNNNIIVGSIGTQWYYYRDGAENFISFSAVENTRKKDVSTEIKNNKFRQTTAVF